MLLSWLLTPQPAPCRCRMQNEECLGKRALRAGERGVTGGMEKFSIVQCRFANIYNCCKGKEEKKEGVGTFDSCCVAFLL